MKQKAKIAAIQLNLFEGGDANRQKAAKFISEAAEKGAEIICLPELYSSKYFCQSEEHANFDLAEPQDGESFQFFSALAAELNVQIIVPFFERRMPGIYHNSSMLINEKGENAGFYRKMHIPDDPLFYEKFYFTPGDLGFKSFNTGKAHVGMLICWDQWFPEAARATALQGAEILFYPTAIGWHPSEKEEFGEFQLNAWKSVMRGHAVANGCYVVAVNRIGHEKYLDNDGLEFWGNSFVFGPQGELLAEASHNKEEILMIEMDRKHLETVRQHWPFLRDRRVDAYGGLLKIGEK